MKDLIDSFYKASEIFNDDIEALSIAIIRIGVNKPKRVLNDLEDLRLDRYQIHIMDILSDPIKHLKGRQLTLLEYLELMEDYNA